MASYPIISSDSHVFELLDLWTSRTEPKFREGAPRVVTMEDGDWWCCQEKKLISFGIGAQAGRRFDEPEKLSLIDTFENVLPGGYVPDERIKDMDIDGVDGDVVYPTVGLFLFGVPETELLSALFRTYNDWIGEFCGAFPERLKGIAMLNVDEVQAGIEEMERCAKLGMVGAMIPVSPPEGREYYLPEYEPLWAAAQDMEMPISLHIGTNRVQNAAAIESLTPAFQCNKDHWVRMSLAHMIYAGVLERYPKLQVGTVEHEVHWVPYFLDRMDYVYTQLPRRGDWPRFENDMVPSDFFHRNVFVSFQEDALGVKERDIIGVDNLLWASDYPHQESTFPRSPEILEEILADCTMDEKAKIAGGNTARVYNIR